MPQKPKPPAAGRRKAPATPKRVRAQTPLEFLKSVYREPIPEDADPATRARMIANKLAAAKAAAAYEAQRRAGKEGGAAKSAIAALLRELEGSESDAGGDGDGDGEH